MGFDKTKFIAQYKAETQEHIQKLNQGLLRLEKNPQEKELLETMMREAHTIKGSSTMMGYKRIADIAHQMESGLQKALEGKLKLEKMHFDMLFKSLDAIAPLLEDKVTWEDTGVAHPFADDLCNQIQDVFSGKAAKPAASHAKIKHPATSARKKEPLPAPAIVNQPAAVKQSLIPEDTLRVDIDKLDKLVNFSGELLIAKIRLDELSKNLSHKIETQPEIRDACGALVKELNKVDNNIDFITKGLGDEVLRLRMVSVGSLFNTFPRAMRDLAN